MQDKKNDITKSEKDNYDKFLKKIKSYIKYLGFAAIVVLVHVGIMIAVVLNFDSKFDKIFSAVVSIKDLQYKNNVLDKSYFSDVNKINLIVDNLLEIQSCNENIVFVSKNRFYADTYSLSKTLDSCFSNYAKIKDIFEMRGVDSSSGLVKEFYENDNDFFNKISDTEIRNEFVFLNDIFSDYNEKFKNASYNYVNMLNIIFSFQEKIEKLDKLSMSYGDDLSVVIAKKKYDVLMSIFALDRNLVDIGVNNNIQFYRIITSTDNIRKGIEKNKRIFKNILSLVIVFSLVVGIVFFILMTLYLSHAMMRSINLFNSLWLEKAANDAKDAFVSNISHELRTPINTILGMDELIQRDTNELLTKERSDHIQTAGKNLLNIVNDILDNTKLAAGKMTLINDNYEVASLIAQLENMVVLNATAKKLDFIVEVAPNIPKTLYGDEKRISQCILNLLTNAVKYTNKGFVKLRVTFDILDGDSIFLVVSVSDSGIGINKDDLDRLCSPFERLDENKNRTIEGTGLGLNIVKNLLALMDSQIDVVSEYGKGSEFYFTIIQKVVSWECIGNYKERYHDFIQEQKIKKYNFIAPAARILVVDDTFTNLEVVKGLLTKTEMEIDAVTSGEEAISAASANHYDIIFIDYRMPVMDGIETLHALKELSESCNKNTPCIALTANAIKGSKEMFLEEGFADYLSKPVEGRLLRKMIMKYLPENLIDEEIEDISETEPKNEEAFSILKKLEGIDYNVAMKYCDQESVLYNAVLDFALSIDEKSNNIEKFYKANDFKNYNILVHSLKSTSRLIGADELSSLAEHLEKCSNDAENYIGEINIKTPVLLNMYRSYSEKFAPVVAQNKKSSTGKDLISMDQLKDAYSAILELVRAFDFRSAGDIVSSIEESNSIPDNEMTKFNKVKELIRNIKHDEIIELLKV